MTSLPQIVILPSGTKAQQPISSQLSFSNLNWKYETWTLIGCYGQHGPLFANAGHTLTIHIRQLWANYLFCWQLFLLTRPTHTCMLHSAERACVLHRERAICRWQTPLVAAYLHWEQNDRAWWNSAPIFLFPSNICCWWRVGRHPYTPAGLLGTLGCYYMGQNLLRILICPMGIHPLSFCNVNWQISCKSFSAE